MPELNETDLHILQYISQGHLELKPLAKKLGLSFDSLRYRMCLIYKKYNVHTLAQLVLAIRFEHLSRHVMRYADPLVCDCGQRAIWRAPVVINHLADHLLLCDACKENHVGKVEPALVILTNEQYGAMHDLVVRFNEKPLKRRKNGIQVKNPL